MKLSSPFSVKYIVQPVSIEGDLGYLVADSPQDINECFHFSHTLTLLLAAPSCS